MKKTLKIKFLPYERMNKTKLKDILKDLKANTIILIDAKLNPNEEAKLIEETMKKVSGKFSGIEMCSLDLTDIRKDDTLGGRIKEKLIEKIIGKKRGLTVIGHAKIIKKIEKDPENLLLYI